MTERKFIKLAKAVLFKHVSMLSHSTRYSEKIAPDVIQLALVYIVIKISGSNPSHV